MNIIEAFGKVRERGGNAVLGGNPYYVNDVGSIIFRPTGKAWFIGVEELLSNDWEYIPPPNTLTFREAITAMHAGKKVKRLAWDSMDTRRHMSSEYDDDIEATDWVVVE